MLEEALFRGSLLVESAYAKSSFEHLYKQNWDSCPKLSIY